MAEPTLYLFDGYNLLHAGAFADARELRDALSSFVALRGARGILVFDGVGRDETIGPLRVRFAADADAVLERLAAEHRASETVAVVSSDFAIRGTTGQEVRSTSSRVFLTELEQAVRPSEPRPELADRLDPGVRERLERLRRGE